MPNSTSIFYTFATFQPARPGYPGMDRLLSPTGSTPNLTNPSSSYMPHHWSSTNLPTFDSRFDNRYEGHYNVSEGRFNTIAGHGHWHHPAHHHSPRHHPHFSPTAHGHFVYPSVGHHHVPSSSMSVLPTTGGGSGAGGGLAYSLGGQGAGSSGNQTYATSHPKNPPLGYIVAYTPEQIADLMKDQLGGVPQVTPTGQPAWSPSHSPKHRPLSVHTSTLSKVRQFVIALELLFYRLLR